MDDQAKAKQQLIDELKELRQRISRLETVEGALRESEERYRAIFSNSAVGILVTDGNGKFIDANSALLKMLGFRRQELESAQFADITHPDDVEISRNKFGGLVRGEIESYRIEKRYIRKDGEIVWVDLSVAAIVDEKGVCVATFGVTVDITERKRSEEALREANEVFHTFADQLPANVFIKDHNSRLQYVNKYVREVYDSGDWIGRDASEYFPPEVAKMVLADEKKVLLNGPMVREEWIPDKKGVRRLWETRKFPIHREGKPPLLGGVSIDITERKKAEDALRESREKYRMIFEHAPLGILHFDHNGEMLDFNDKFVEMMGAPREALIGFNMPERQKDERMRQAVLDVLSGKTSYYEGDYLSVTGGKLTSMRAFYSPVLADDGRFLGAVGIFEDFTHAKRAKEEQEKLRNQLLQAQKMEAIGTLAGGIAHDFNNLLTVVQGFSELMLAEKDQKHPEYADLQKIFHAARNGADLVQRLLMFSRKSEPKPVPMNLNKQIVQVEKLLRRTIPRMIDIKLELSADVPEINTDPAQMEQVLMNLCINARDAMPDGGKLTVRTSTVTLDEDYCRLHAEPDPGEYVLLEIWDTGHGMDKDTVERIFEPFFTTKEIGRGTGLGLAIVYGIVKDHNGHIIVFSAVGKGTTFRVYLPAIQVEVETDVETDGIMPAFGTETVLLVDDEDFVRELGARILTKHGYTVLQATNGREALDLFKKESLQISLTILDLIMPEMGGLECLKELLQIDPQVKVLVASGYSAEASVKETIQLGAKGFVSKPFRVQDLLRNVRRVLDRG